MKKIKSDWNFKNFYKSETDTQIEKDAAKFSDSVDKFVKRYTRNNNYLKSVKELRRACDEYEKVIHMPEADKPIIYFYLKKDQNSNNKKAEGEYNKYSQLYTKIVNKILFFELSLGKISEKQQSKFLKSRELKKYYYFLLLIFKASKYQLTEGEEKVLSLMNGPAQEMWVSSNQKILSNKTVKFRNREVSLSEAISTLAELSVVERRALAKKINKKFFEVSDFSEAEINALFTNKKIRDELRGLKKPYTATVMSYQNEDETVENLVKTVVRNYGISKRFYRVKAKMLKMDKLRYEDRAAQVGKNKKKFTFENTTKILSTAFKKISKKYQEYFESYLLNGQIDVYPRLGKSSGAYCLSTNHHPTYILLNHSDDFNSVVTLAHEMGHAFHGELSKKQDLIYSGYTIPTAEVASTFFENFIFDEVLETLNDEEKIVALHDKIEAQVSTIFRQIACFNFENELHQNIRERGYMSKQEIARLMNVHMKKYLGSVFEINESDGYFFTYWSHIRRFFYVYSYAFGSIVSSALYANYKKDKNFIKKVEKFLSAGASKSPEDIFSEIGVDIRNPDFFESGLKLILGDIKKLEKLLK